ncbi:hypothetical protein SAMN04487949_2340 [Halogranum gelatinilyticum]|uniref:Uncharacterized protein n=1 Tax=Halogranum gelatinilyticum TaxID=660521 RepID=A0A1G9UUC2_9EURY|nr:hypothetical protein [Halogranum gelatinilyticum]SDM63397.1 hypothetical protein SAMN04487949_2340 [Halogranum gelatinilyticum]
MPAIAGYTPRKSAFVLLTTGVVVVTWYFTEPAGTNLASSLVAGLVVFLVLLLVLRLDSERVKQTLLDLLPLLP